MLPAKSELQHYADSVGADLPHATATAIARTISRMTPDEADAWMALIQAAEEQGHEVAITERWDVDALGNPVQLPGDYQHDLPIIR